MSRAQFTTAGPKLSYTFGDHPGFTAGFEVTVFRSNPFQDFFQGITFDLTFYGKKHTTLHIGAEHFRYVPDVSFAIYGFDVGPTIFFGEKISIGASMILFGGEVLYPFYEFAISTLGVIDQSIGSYLKFPVSGFGH